MSRITLDRDEIVEKVIEEADHLLRDMQAFNSWPPAERARWGEAGHKWASIGYLSEALDMLKTFDRLHKLYHVGVEE